MTGFLSCQALEPNLDLINILVSAQYIVIQTVSQFNFLGFLSYGEEISENIIAHYSDKDELVEIEILDASKFLKIKKEVIIPEKTAV